MTTSKISKTPGPESEALKDRPAVVSVNPMAGADRGYIRSAVEALDDPTERQSRPAPADPPV